MEWVQHPEIVVSGDNVGRLAIHRELQKLVIAGVATIANSDINLDPSACPSKDGKKLPRIIFCEVRPEFFPGKHLVKFCHDRQRKQDCATVQATVESAPGGRFVGQGCTDQYAGVKDEAQLTFLSRDFPISAV